MKTRYPKEATVFDLNTPYWNDDGSLTYEGVDIVFNYGQWCIECRRLSDGRGPGAMPLSSLVPRTPAARRMIEIARSVR